jgi:hypothetical protein
LTKLNQYLGEAFSISGAAYDVLVKLTDRTKTETEFVTLSELRLLDNIFGIDLYDYSRKDVDQVPESVVESFKVIKGLLSNFSGAENREKLTLKPPSCLSSIYP